LDSQIPTLTLPSGGTVEFKDMDDLTGADLHELRKAIRTEDGAGATSNALYIAAIRMMVKTWDIPYAPLNQDPRTPEFNPAAWKKLRARDLGALEAAISPVLELLKPPDAVEIDSTPGSPIPPDSE